MSTGPLYNSIVGTVKIQGSDFHTGPYVVVGTVKSDKLRKVYLRQLSVHLIQYNTGD